jgi:hypothetical protein
VSDFIIREAADVAAAVNPRPGVLAAARGPVFVEVGGSAVAANITRDGKRVPNVALDPAGIADIIGGAVTRPRLKVLRQSVEAGRAVERGTAVDLVRAEPGRLPIGIVAGVHAALATRTMGDVFATLIAPNADVARIIRTVDNPAALSATDRQTLAAALTQAGVGVEAGDTAAITSAFAGLQAASVFGS